jgi:hypothetical protein
MSDRAVVRVSNLSLTRRSWLAGAGAAVAWLLGRPSLFRAQSAPPRSVVATLIAGEPSASSAVLQARIARGLAVPGDFDS